MRSFSISDELHQRLLAQAAQENLTVEKLLEHWLDNSIADKRALETLQVSEERFKLLAQLMANYVLSHRINQDGTVETEWVVGKSFEQRIGFATPPFNYWDITHPDDIERVRNDIQKTLHNQITMSEYRIRKSDGHYLWISATRYPIWDEAEGRVIRYYNIVQDIHERKQAEEALRRQNEYLTVLHQITLNLLNRHHTLDLLQSIVDHAAKIMDAPYGEIMFLEGDTLIVQACTDNQRFVIGDRAKRGEAVLAWQAFDTGQVVTIDDYATFPARRSLYNSLSVHAVACFPIIVGNNSLGVLDLSRAVPDHPFTPEQIQHGVLFSQLAALLVDSNRLYEATLHEIAERERTEQLRLEQERLKASLKKEQEFNALAQKAVSALSHDVRTPLSVILNAKDILTRYYDRLDEEKRREKLETIDRQLHYVMDLLDEVTKVVQGTSKHGVFKPSTVNLVALCQASVNEIQETSGSQHQLYFTTDGYVQTAYVDETLVSRILLNLLSNAVKFSPEGTKICLELSHHDDWIVLQVIDQGMGISTEDQQHIFEPSYRSKAVHGISGTGMGLNIVQDCVQRHNGRISVTSEYGHGSTFTIELPFVRA